MTENEHPLSAEKMDSTLEPAPAGAISGTRRKKLRFGTGLLLYAWILLVLLSVVLVLFYQFLGSYERTRPQHAVDAYLQALQQQATPAVAEAFSDLDPAIRSTEEDLIWAKPLLAEASLIRDPANSTEARKAYTIRTADRQIIGSVVFAVTNRVEYGLPVWEAVEEHFDFSPYYTMMKVIVPSDYSVYLGGKLLGPESVTETGIPYKPLEECYQHYDNLPTKIRYDGGPFVGEAALRILDEQGQELGIDDLTDARFLSRCSEEQRNRAEDFIDVFLPTYLYFSSDINGSAYKYYLELLPIVREGSQMSRQMNLALQSFGWSNTRAATILSVTYNNLTDLGEGRLLVDLSYELRITGLHEPAVRRDDIQLILVEEDGAYLADALYLYDSETRSD